MVLASRACLHLHLLLRQIAQMSAGDVWPLKHPRQASQARCGPVAWGNTRNRVRETIASKFPPSSSCKSPLHLRNAHDQQAGFHVHRTSRTASKSGLCCCKISAKAVRQLHHADGAVCEMTASAIRVACPTSRIWQRPCARPHFG